MTELHDLPAREIAARVAGGALSARRVTEAALARIAATEPRLKAFIHVAGEDALAQADAVDAAISAGRPPGPLAGVPVSVKDLVHVAGQPTSFGSVVFAGQPAPGDAVPIARLRAAGAILIGKTTTPEFGHKALTESPLFGRTLNPWNADATCGGSSGGAAVSVAARQVPLAVGTDGGGSIRIPASVCGLWGLKPTLGRVPHVQAPDLFANNAYLGPIARDLEDLRLMQRVMAGPHPGDPWSKALPPLAAAPALGSLRVGFALLAGNPAIDPEVAAAVEAARHHLAGLVAEVRPVRLDFHAREPIFRVLLETALASRVGPRLASDRARFDPSFVRVLELGQRHGGVALQAAGGVRSALFRELEALFEEVDLLLTPTLAAPALAADSDPHAPVVIEGLDCGPIRAGWYPYTWPLNLTGHPALSMPCGWSRTGVPLGLQLAAPWYAEELLFAVAAALAPALVFEVRQPGV